jgi:hypothetical protein
MGGNEVGSERVGDRVSLILVTHEHNVIHGTDGAAADTRGCRDWLRAFQGPCDEG